MKKLDKIDEDDVSWFRKQTLKDVDLVSLTSKKRCFRQIWWYEKDSRVFELENWINLTEQD